MASNGGLSARIAAVTSIVDNKGVSCEGQKVVVHNNEYTVLSELGKGGTSKVRYGRYGHSALRSELAYSSRFSHIKLDI